MVTPNCDNQVLYTCGIMVIGLISLANIIYIWFQKDTIRHPDD